MSKRIMVTGCNGYIGCMLCKELNERGHRVIGVDNRLYPHNFKLDGYSYEVDGVEYHEKDIRDMTREDFEGVDVLVHMAGLSNDPIGEINDRVTRNINVYATVESASLAKKAGVKKLIFSSSCSVYGYSPMESPVFFNEDSPKNPVSTYAESKLVCEGALNNLIDSDFNVYILRNATVYGPSPRMRFDLLINAMIASSFFQQTIIFYSNPLVKRPLVHIRDLCNVFIHFIENDLKSDIYNVGRTLDNYSISDIAILVTQAFYERFGQDIKLRYKIDNADPRSYLVSFGKLQDQCRELITHDVYQSIRDLIDDFAKNFTPDDQDLLKRDTSYYSIHHLLRRLELGELDHEFRVVKRRFC